MTINLVIEVAIIIFMIIAAFLALNAKKLVNSVIYLSVLSMLCVVGFAVMKAPDVAITEAVIGSGLVTALFLFTLLTKKKEGVEK